MSSENSNRLFDTADYVETSVALAKICEALHGASIFVTGGTGFFGTWLLGLLLHAAEENRTPLLITVLSRRPDMFRAARPAIAFDKRVRLLEGDVCNFVFPNAPFTHVLHAATEASATLNVEQPVQMLDTIIRGTQRVLEMTQKCGAHRFLLTSSGAAYGKQPQNINNLTEDYMGAPDTTAIDAAYGQGKRFAEVMACAAGRQSGFEAVIARCWAFSGAYLPLDGTYALGNFVRDALSGGPIQVGGDGTALRSYLYGTDLAVWLWRLLVHGQNNRIYNVGSEEAVSIKELAKLVAECAGEPQKPLDVQIAKVASPNQVPPRYVPSVARINEELGLRQSVGLREGILRMLAHHKGRT